MMTAMLGERIVIANRLPELRRMTQWLHDGAAALGMAQKDVFRLDVCANEAVVNIISYAYADDLLHDIALELHKTGKSARLEIRDNGRPFNLLDVPEHEAPGTIEDARIGGLGTHLIKRMIPDCWYRRDGSINVLTLEL